MNRFSLRCLAMLAAAVLLLAGASPTARACPFCNAAMQTLSQEIQGADVALIAQLIKPMPLTGDGQPDYDAAAAKFRVLHVLRGADRLEGAKEINVVYFGDDDPQKRFYITGLAGVTGPGLDWTTPVPLSEVADEYLRQLPKLPTEGVERLEFFQTYLEHEDPLLAQDAYDEFARTPYDQVVELGPQMNRERLIEWIESPRVGPSGRRLYLTMLGVCAKPEDVELLEQLMNFDYPSMQPGIAAAIGVGAAFYPALGIGVLDEMIHAEEQLKRESLDALIACYLKLKGPAGLELVNRLFMANPDVEYKHLHFAIAALRFLGEQTDILPREELVKSLRNALDHEPFIDQVIPDLARWEDWELMPRLVTMFKEAPEAKYWIRSAVAAYLLEAEQVEGDVGVQAKAAIAELEARDAKTFEDARRNSSFAFLARAASGGPGANAFRPAETAATDEGAADGAATTEADGTATGGTPPVEGVADATDTADSQEAADSSEGETDSPAETAEAPADADQAEQVAAATRTAPATPPFAAAQATPPSTIKIIGIPLVAAGVLLAIFAVLLRGADPRSSDETP
jgi:hypothetical protein